MVILDLKDRVFMSDLKIKIKKLLALSTSANEAEALAALNKATELIANHNFNLSELTALEVNETPYKTPSVLKTECGYYFAKGLGFKYGFTAYIKGKDVVIVGNSSAKEIAESLMDFLFEAMERAHKQAAILAKAEGWWDRSFSPNFKKSFAYTILQRLKTSEPSSTFALVPVLRLDGAIAKHMAQLTIKKSSSKIQAGEAFNLAQDAAQAVNLDRQVKPQSPKTKFIKD
jgi:hypothetical protein